MSLLDPGLRVSDHIEAECRRVMAERAKLKRHPGTHGQQADMLADVDHLIDQWHEVMADDGQATAPHA